MSVPGTPTLHQAIELDLIQFYGRLVAEEFHRDVESSDVRFLERVREAYCKKSIENSLSNITFDHPGMRCAYIFLNTPCFSRVVASDFEGLFYSNHWLFQRTLDQGSMSVCCLGCGPALELLAIVKVLEIMLRFHHLRREVVIRATVVDIDSGWGMTAKWITQNWWKHFDASLIKLRLTFVQADLTDPLGPEVREAIGSADLVTMVKFLSAIFGTDKRNRIPSVLQEITDCLPVGGVLYLMNSFRFGGLEALRGAMGSGNHMKIIYISDCVYSLSYEARAECLRFYSEYYGNIEPTMENRSNVIAWVKWNQINNTIQTK